jgi:hypothetical protein
VSTTAIVKAAAARATAGGTSFARTATYCHWYGRPFGKETSAGSSSERLAAVRSTRTIPGSAAIFSAKRSTLPAGRSATACSGRTRRTIRAGCRSSAAARAWSLSYVTTAVPSRHAAAGPGSRAPRADPTSARPVSTAKQNRWTSRIQISLI